MPVPTVQEWIARVGKTPMPAMKRIETLIERCNKIRDEGGTEEESRTAGRRRGAVGGVFSRRSHLSCSNSSERSGSRRNMPTPRSKERSGRLTPSTDEKIIERFGKNVRESEKKKDQVLRDKGVLVEFLTPRAKGTEALVTAWHTDGPSMRKRRRERWKKKFR